MLGQRILETLPQLEEPEGSPSAPAFHTGLTVRRTKSTGLRIITESEALLPDTSKVRLPRTAQTTAIAIPLGACDTTLPIRQSTILPVHKVCRAYNHLPSLIKSSVGLPTPAIRSVVRTPPCSRQSS